MEALVGSPVLLALARIVPLLKCIKAENIMQSLENNTILPASSYNNVLNIKFNLFTFRNTHFDREIK